MTPRESATARSPTPASNRILVHAIPAAPAPETTTRRSASSRPTTPAALRRAAPPPVAPRAPPDEGLGARDPGRAGAGDDDPQVGQLPADHPRRVAQRGQDDDRRPVLVVVHDRDVQPLAQPVAEPEAAGGPG